VQANAVSLLGKGNLVSNPSEKPAAVRSHAYRRGAGALVGLGLILAVVASCAGDGSSPDQAPASNPGATPSSTLEPTPSPTPVATPTPTPKATADEIKAACAGKPVLEAAKYAGTLHPLAAVYWSGASDGAWTLDHVYDIDAKWFGDLWPSPIQLVVCVGESKEVRVSSCGTYRRSSDNVVGQLVRNRLAEVVNVVVASTGKTLQSKTFYGTTPKCAFDVEILGGNPPWAIHGTAPDDVAINQYATSVSTQAVK
jgi:hypothetical protein